MNTFLNANLRLAKATEGVEGVKPGQPSLFAYWPNQVQVFSEPTIFLAEHVVKVSPSAHRSLKETIDTYLAHVSIFGEKQGITDIRRLLGLPT